MRESKYRTSFSSTKFFFDCDEILDLRSRNVFWTVSAPASAPATLALKRKRLRQPRASSSSISRSLSWADIDRYRAVTLYRFDALVDLAAPSLEPTVFCLDTGTKPDDVDDAAEFLVEGASMVVTDMATGALQLRALSFRASAERCGVVGDWMVVLVCRRRGSRTGWG